MKMLKQPLKLEIQHFAEDGAADPQEPVTPTVEDLLKTVKAEELLNHEALRSALDSRIGKATQTALTNARKKWEEEQNENLSEAEKLAKMTKEEKEKYNFQKERERFESEKAQFQKEKLVVEAAKQLAEKGIDASLAEFVVGKDADETKTRLEIFEKAFNTAVEGAVNGKIKGKEPIKKAPTETGKTFSEEEIAKMTTAQINENWEAISKSLANK